MSGNLLEFVDMLQFLRDKLSLSDAIYQLIVTLGVFSCNCAFLVFELIVLSISLSIMAFIN